MEAKDCFLLSCCSCSSFRPAFLVLEHKLSPPMATSSLLFVDEDLTPWFVMTSGDDSYVAWVSAMNKWWPFRHINPLPNRLLCASGEILCSMGDANDLILSNPLSGTKRHVIPPITGDLERTAVFMVRAAGSCYLLVVSGVKNEERSPFLDSKIDIYDVKEQVWMPPVHCQGQIDRYGVIGHFQSSTMHYSDFDIRHCDIFAYRFDDNCDWKLSGFCISYNAWAIIDVEMPRNVSFNENVDGTVVWKDHRSDRIFLAAALRSKAAEDMPEYEYPIPEFVGVWELYRNLDGSSYWWREMSTSPPELLDDFSRQDPNAIIHISWATFGSHVCMTAKWWQSSLEVKYSRPITYNIDRNRWLALGKDEHKICREEVVLAYTPSSDDAVLSYRPRMMRYY